MNIRTLLNTALSRINHRLLKLRRRNPNMLDMLEDIRPYLPEGPLTYFDVGANEGQTIRKFKQSLPPATIHAFEPDPRCTKILTEQYGDDESVKLVQAGVGDSQCEREFKLCQESVMNSFLEQAERSSSFVPSAETETIKIKQITLDDYVERNGIDRVDVLKLDVQGFEKFVLRGADKLLASGKVGYLYTEVSNIPTYKDQTTMVEILELMSAHDYLPAGFYVCAFKQNIPFYYDVLFTKLESNYKRKT